MEPAIPAWKQALIARRKANSMSTHSDAPKQKLAPITTKPSIRDRMRLFEAGGAVGVIDTPAGTYDELPGQFDLPEDASRPGDYADDQ